MKKLMAKLTIINVPIKNNVECREIGGGSQTAERGICVICEICVT